MEMEGLEGLEESIYLKISNPGGVSSLMLMGSLSLTFLSPCQTLLLSSTRSELKVGTNLYWGLSGLLAGGSDEVKLIF